MIRKTILLDDDQARRLAEMAKETRLSEEELLHRAVVEVLGTRGASAVPRYARRLGPLTIDQPLPAA
jgi:predicted transcriptional regulator